MTLNFTWIIGKSQKTCIHKRNRTWMKKEGQCEWQRWGPQLELLWAHTGSRVPFILGLEGTFRRMGNLLWRLSRNLDFWPRDTPPWSKKGRMTLFIWPAALTDFVEDPEAWVLGLNWLHMDLGSVLHVEQAAAVTPCLMAKLLVEVSVQTCKALFSF